MKCTVVLALCIAFIALIEAQRSDDDWDSPPRYGHYNVHGSRPGSSSGSQRGAGIQSYRGESGGGQYSGNRGYRDGSSSPGITPLDPRIGSGPLINVGPHGGRYVRYRGNSGAPGVAIRDDYY